MTNVNTYTVPTTPVVVVDRDPDPTKANCVQAFEAKTGI